MLLFCMNFPTLNNKQVKMRLRKCYLICFCFAYGLGVFYYLKFKIIMMKILGTVWKIYAMLLQSYMVNGRYIFYYVTLQKCWVENNFFFTIYIQYDVIVYLC